MARILVSPRLRTSYVNDPSLGRIALKNFQFGACKVAVWRKHPGMLQARHFVPPAFVAALVLGPALAALHGAMGILWLLFLGSYAGACLAVAARSYLRCGERGALLLPVVLPVIHVSWGTGFLVGAARLFGGRLAAERAVSAGPVGDTR